MTVITRFAPSPTGFLHIGSARTALFNYLFAAHHHGKFLLRIEDTDKQRSTKEALEAIFSGLKWLGLNWDGEVVFQSKRNHLYKQAAYQLIEQGKAYYCFSPQEEINQQRQEAEAKKQNFLFKSPWRDAKTNSYPKSEAPVIRLKTPKEGQTIINDSLQGQVVIENSTLDDMILLRSDGTATYMLAVVVDDHDMGITHIIRGDDHLTNAAKQILIYQAFGWTVPSLTHIPLIHSQEGAKLSKRHGALGVQSYKEMGYLPEAIFNYLLRLGWAYKDEEIISKEQAVKWFSLEGLGKSPARLDFAKMDYLNSYYLRKIDDKILVNMIIDAFADIDYKLTDKEIETINKILPELKNRATKLDDMINLAKIYLPSYQLEFEQEAIEIINNFNPVLLEELIKELKNLEDFSAQNINAKLKLLAQEKNIKVADLLKTIRAFVIGRTSSPSITEIISIIGKEVTLSRIKESKKITFFSSEQKTELD